MGKMKIRYCAEIREMKAQKWTMSPAISTIDKILRG
jgi:hypothetical protein